MGARSRIKQSIIGSLIALAIVGGTGPAAQAAWWQENPALGSTEIPKLLFNSTSEPFSRFVRYGSQPWNFRWVEYRVGAHFDNGAYLDPGYTMSITTPPPPGYVGNFAGDIDGQNNRLAQATHWSYVASPTTTYSAVVQYDTSESWFDSSLTNIGATQIDRLGVATHELGHTLGIGHTTGTNWCPGNPSGNTSVMCASTGAGLTNVRSLFPIDRQAFLELYVGP